MTLIQTDKTDFFKDTRTGAVINTNKNALASHRERKNNAEKLATLGKDVRDLQKLMSDVLSILNELKNR